MNIKEKGSTSSSTLVKVLMHAFKPAIEALLIKAEPWSVGVSGALSHTSHDWGANSFTPPILPLFPSSQCLQKVFFKLDL
jgi:hypothetical protein